MLFAYFSKFERYVQNLKSTFISKVYISLCDIKTRSTMTAQEKGTSVPISESATPASAGSTATGVAGSASVKTVKVVVPIYTNEQRLEAMRKGFQVEKSGLVIQVPITSQALEGVDEYGEGYLKRSSNYEIKLDYASFILQGKTVDDAYADYLQRLEKYQKQQEEKKRKLEEKKEKIRQAIKQQFPNVIVGENGDELDVSYSIGGIGDSVSIFVDVDTVERAIDAVADLIKRVEKRENKFRMEQAKKQAEEREKAEWIQKYGSEHLREAFARGYNCQRMYILERVAKELPNYIVYKYDGREGWELYDRSCPSPEAIAEVKRLEAQGFHPVVKWAKLAPSDEDNGGEAEIVYIEDFHGYEVYRIIHFEENEGWDDDC